MNISEVKYYSARELVSRLRTVTMLTNPETKPYENANIQITDLDSQYLSPAQLYVLRSEFEKVRELRWELQKHGVDILRMADTKVRDGNVVDKGHDRAEQLGFVEFLSDGDTVTLLPPIVEVHREANSSLYNIINDGMHRCFLGRVTHTPMAVVVIRDVPKHLPYYAYPLVDGWAGVTMVDKLDGKILKKFHRMPDYKAFYRNFNSSFTNVGGPRGKGK